MLGTPSARELAARLDAAAQQGTIRIDDVRVGRRHHHDLGDIAGRSIGAMANILATAAIMTGLMTESLP